MATTQQSDPRQQEQRSFSLKVKTGIKAGSFEVDEHGFITDPNDWEKEVAAELAKLE